MATYKVLQDIEAEDKLLGPLTLKQFIFALITLALGFISFKLATTGSLGVARWPIMTLFILPMALFGFLAAPLGKDQPNDIWLVARMRYWFKPRTRIWNQDGLSDLVTITAPKKIEKVYTDGLSQNEVRSRLKALANTLDSRGWAVKNVPTNLYAQPGLVFGSANNSDRLVQLSPNSTPSPILDASDATDILDEKSNETAIHLGQMVEKSEQDRRRLLLEKMKSVKDDATTQQTTITSEPIIPLDQPIQSRPQSVDAVIDKKTEEEFLNRVHAFQAQQQSYHSHIKTIQPLDQPSADSQTTFSVNETSQHSTAAAHTLSDLSARAQSNQSNFSPPGPNNRGNTQSSQNTTIQPSINPGILALSRNNDLTLDTLSRQAEKQFNSGEEVVISLRQQHESK